MAEALVASTRRDHFKSIEKLKMSAESAILRTIQIILIIFNFLSGLGCVAAAEGILSGANVPLPEFSQYSRSVLLHCLRLGGYAQVGVGFLLLAAGADAPLVYFSTALMFVGIAYEEYRYKKELIEIRAYPAHLASLDMPRYIAVFMACLAFVGAFLSDVSTVKVP